MENAFYFQKTGVPLSVFWIILKMKSQSCIYVSFLSVFLMLMYFVL